MKHFTTQFIKYYNVKYGLHTVYYNGSNNTNTTNNTANNNNNNNNNNNILNIMQQIY